MVLCKEEATSDKATDHVTHGGVPRAGCRGLTTGECAVKRLSPQLVVTYRPLAMEITSHRHQGQPGTGVSHPETAPRNDAPQPARVRTEPQTGRDSSLSAPSPLLSRKAPDRQAGTKSIFATPLARGGAERCCIEKSSTQFVTSAIGPVNCPRRGFAANSPLETTLGFAYTNLRPYFSSSLTLSIRGAVSPARHVLTRPRPHPVFRQGGERIAGPVFVKEHGDVICPVRESLS
jgi:hypothetical protein